MMGAPLCPAVIPTLLGPLQTLLLIAPLLVLGVVLALRSLLQPLTWKLAFARIAHAMRTRPLRCALAAGALAVLVSAGRWALDTAPPLVRRSDDAHWTTFHGNAARRGTNDSELLSLDFTLAWKFRDPAVIDRLPLVSSPAVTTDRVIIGSDNHRVYCLDLASGTLLWTFEAKAPVFSSPALEGNRVYVGEGLHEDSGCALNCLGLEDGKLLWKVTTASHVESSPTSSNGRVYFGAGEDGLYCCDSRTGVVLWHDRRGHVDASPLVVEGRVYCGSGYGWTGVACLDAEDGRDVWRVDLPAAAWGAMAFSAGSLFVPVGNGSFDASSKAPLGELRCLDPATGDTRWSYAVSDGVLTAVAVASGRAVFGSRNGYCYAIDAATGEELWKTPLGAPVLSSPAISGRFVIVGADDGRLHGLDLDDGRKIATFDTQGDLPVLGIPDARIQSSPAVSKGRIVFGAANGHVYALGGEDPRGAVTGAFRSRGLRAADHLLTSWIGLLDRCCSSLGLALILGAISLRVLLLPLDWGIASQAQRLRALGPDLRALRSETLDSRVLSYELRKALRTHGVEPLRLLALTLVQFSILLIVLWVFLGTQSLEGRAFLFVDDLSKPDRLVEFGSASSSLPGVFPVLLGFTTGILVWRGRALRGGLAATCAVLLGLSIMILTSRWPAGVHLFVIVLVVTGGIAQHWLGRLLHSARAGTMS